MPEEVAKVGEDHGAAGGKSGSIVEEQSGAQPGYFGAVGAYSLPQMLVEAGLLTWEQVTEAQRAARREKLPLADILLRDGMVLSLQLATLSALNLGLTMVDLGGQDIDPEAVALLPEEIARKYSVLAIKISGKRLTVAMTDPTDLQLIHDLSSRTGCEIQPVTAVRMDILEHIDMSYKLSQELAEDTPTGTLEPGSRVSARLLRSAPPAKVIDMLLHQALQDRASDIHIEADEARLRVRFRIDGILHDVMDLPLEMHPTIISRLKIMGGLNIAERRRPQDGQFTVDLVDRQVDVRLAISNTVENEMAVMRLLDKGFTLLTLEQLGMGRHQLEKFRRLLKLPYGMVVVCGPTGAGKSTTLYGSILQMNRVEANVISIEDPVEYHIGSINQMQVHVDAGVTFATQLRSILRLDPDVILVGEIRDQETAVIATQAALTGHLVLTSIHANDAVSALIRFRDLGVAPYLISSSVAGIVSQRMVRTVCRDCQIRTPRPAAEQEAYAAEMGETQEQFIYGSGCNMCAQTGYRGRTAVFEIMTMSDTLRQLFIDDASRKQLLDQALLEGMIPLRKDGMMKVQEGITTPYEVMRVLFSLE